MPEPFTADDRPTDMRARTLRRRGSCVTIIAAALVATACTSPSPSQPSPSPSEPSPSPPDSGGSPGLSPSPGAEGVVATIQVGDEEYRILLTDPADIAIARRLLAGEEAPRIPNGVIVRGSDGGVNTGWSWHIDPESLEFAEVTIEVCDGLPSYVEDGSLTGDRFCPWAAEVTAIEE